MLSLKWNFRLCYFNTKNNKLNNKIDQYVKKRQKKSLTNKKLKRVRSLLNNKNYIPALKKQQNQITQ